MGMVRPGLASQTRRSLLALCLLLLVHVSEAAAGAVRLYWDPNSEADLAGYVLVYGSSPGVYTQSVTLGPGAVTHEVTGLGSGTWYFAIRAFNTAGLHSGYSNEVQVVLSNAPVITAVAPSSGPIDGGTLVTISGSGFVAGATVDFGTEPATVTAQNSTSITVISPPNAAGTVALTVSNPDGGAATRSSAFTYTTTTVSLSEPTIAIVSPANGPTSGGTLVTISGSDFREGAAVRIGGTAATVVEQADSWITVSTPPRSAGAAAVTVTNPDGGTVTLASAFTYVEPSQPVSAPTITSVMPATGSTAGGTVVIVSGADFLPGAAVLFGGTAVTVSSQTPTSLTLVTPPRAAGPVTLTVSNPDGGVVAMPSAFTYVAPPATVTPPTVTGLTPGSGPTTGGTDVAITGTGFQAGVVVRFGGVAGTVLSRTATTMTVRTSSAVAGAVAVTVTNPDGGTVSVPSAFTYVTPQGSGTTPTLSSFSPASGPISGGTLVTINGTNFRSGAIVRFGSVAATVTSFTTTRLVARTPAQAEGVVALTVLNSDGVGVQLPNAFTYRAPAPTVSSVSPARGPASGSTDVTIAGSNFRPGLSVAVNSIEARVLSVTATRIVARMPAHVPAVVGISVTNPDSQSAARANAYTYVDGGPAVTQVLPASGPMAGGSLVTLVGSGFFNASVSFGGVNAPIVSRTTEMITVRTPARGAGQVDVTVRNSDGISIAVPGAYTYEDPSAPFVRYFAEGAAGSFFATRFALANPHAEAVAVEVTYTDTQGTATTQTVEVPGRGRVTLEASNRPALASEAFATVFSAPKVIGVERTMTWAAGGPAYGAHSDTGVAAPRTSWVLAEGATIGGFNTFYLLQNPTAETAQVKVQYLLADGERIERIHPVAPLSRTNIWVNKDDPALAAAEMSATVTSLNGVPVVVERSMYRNSATELFAAGHNSAAVDAPALRWFLAEGATGGTFDEFVLVANPNPVAAQLRVSYLRAGRAPLVKSYVAGPQSRLTIWVDQEAPELANAEVSVVVESLTPTPVVVERSMWWRADAAGEWVEAHNSRGVTTTAARWLVADGEAGGPGQASTYVLVANTGATAQPIAITLLPEQGTPRTVSAVVSGNGRFTIDVAGTFPEVAEGRFGVLVEGSSPTAPLVVERASYASTPSTPWAAGTNSLALPLP